MTSDTNTRWHQEPMVWFAIAIPAAAIVSGIAMIVLSIVSFDGLVVDDYYKKGLEINTTLERQEAAHALGLSASVVVEPAQLTVTLSADQSVLLPPVITFGAHHATKKDFDQVVQLRLTTDNTYVGEFSALPPGRWYWLVETPDWRLHSTRVTTPLTNARIQINSRPL